MQNNYGAIKCIIFPILRYCLKFSLHNLRINSLLLFLIALSKVIALPTVAIAIAKKCFLHFGAPIIFSSTLKSLIWFVRTPYSQEKLWFYWKDSDVWKLICSIWISPLLWQLDVYRMQVCFKILFYSLKGRDFFLLELAFTKFLDHLHCRLVTIGGFQIIKRFYTRGRIKGIRVTQLSEIPTFFHVWWRSLN